ncbi:MAG: hypothetical protein OEM64_01710 [Gammaproteobacteria bacterium]|nr:hypothetical protein [Gammaproteobacteria bacterium]MDH3415003.1 hypothetical protein [Gammaproteobacteria bacterium]
MKCVAISTLIPLFFLAACGSGDSTFNGRDNNDQNDPPLTGLAIDANNAMAVASAAYAAALDSGELAGLAGTTGLTSTKTGGSSKPLPQVRTNGLLGQIVQKIPLGTEVYECLMTGMVSVTIDIVDPLVLAAGAFSVGDNFLVDYDNCNDGADETIDGIIDLTVSAFEGDIFSGLYDLSMTMIITALQVTTPTDVISTNGNATARLNLLELLYAEATVSGSSVTLDYNNMSDTLIDFSSMQTVDVGALDQPYTMVTQGTLTTTRLAGSVVYSTPVMFAGLGSSYPYTGEFFVAGENSSIRLVADNDVDVHIDIDSNGDTVVDETIVTTWAELTSM